MANYPKGSMGAAEQKQGKIFLIVAAVITLLVMLSVFVFKTDLNAFMHRASWGANIIGGLCFGCSWYFLYWGWKNDIDAKGGIAWFVLMALGFCFSTGFNFDYFGL